MADLDKLDNVIDDLEKSSNSIKQIPSVIKSVEHLTELTNQNIQALTEMKGQNASINQMCENSSNALNDYCIKGAEQNATFISKVNTMLLEIKNENNSLYKEFNLEIATKFERFKSDIIVENRNIISEIQRVSSQKIGRLSMLCASSLVVSIILLIVLIVK